jgi:Fe2+ or Zn2+ uptake regulation protein
MEQLTISLVCCGKPMKDLGEQDVFNTYGETLHEFICLECGNTKQISDNIDFDDEELLNLLEHNKDGEIENSQIYKELKERLGK